MKKPTEAIERFRLAEARPEDEDAILAYLDSIPEWPADLTRERLEELAMYVQRHICSVSSDKLIDALRRLAELAPKREVQNKWIGCGECDTCFDCHEGKTRCIRLDKKEKRKVELWYHESWADAKPPYAQYAGQSELINGVDGWRKVGVAEIDA